jgi:3-oxoacyl-[acyl-carrier protein] reductase
MPGSGRPVAVVSGGSRGIGSAVVRRLAIDGHDIALCYKSNAEAAELSAKAAREHGARVLARQVDVTDLDACRGLITSAEEELGPVRVVVTSAGIVRDKPMVMMDATDWTEVVNTNLTGTFNICRAAILPMMKRKSGSVITISSVSGSYGNVGQANYSASKAGIVGFSKAMAKEVGRYGIRVNVVAPGLIVTDMTEEIAKSITREKLALIPLRRLGQPAEVADLVSFLASDRAAYVTAGVFPVDGGMAP